MNVATLSQLDPVGHLLYRHDGLEARRFQHQTKSESLDRVRHLHRLLGDFLWISAVRLQCLRLRGRRIPDLKFRPDRGCYSLGTLPP